MKTESWRITLNRRGNKNLKIEICRYGERKKVLSETDPDEERLKVRTSMRNFLFRVFVD